MPHKINLPAKVLQIDVTSAVPGIEWPFDDGLGDPYWSGGATPKPYRWEIIMTVVAKAHGSHLTRDAFVYNGLDINVGDWIGGATTGISLKIISISSKTTGSVTCIIEDVLRYNTFRSAVGDGIFTAPGPGVIFEINENGKPIVDPLPVAVTSSDFFANLDSRFKAFTLQDNFQIDQSAHGFTEGDAVSIDPVTKLYEKTDSNSLEYMVGTVGSDGPGPDAFLLKPTTRVIEDYKPAFPGTKGSFIYADPSSPGGLTTTKTARKAFLQLTDAVESSALGTVANPTTTIGNQLKINGTTVTFSGTSLTQAVIDINAAMTFAGNNVVATDPLDPNIAQASLTLIYGLVGVFDDPPGGVITQATINGTLVTFSDLTDGIAAFALNVAIQSDMARVINLANIPNLVATSDATDLILTETTGGAITIVNTTPDSSGSPFAGNNSGSGIALVTPATTSRFLKLTNSDGDEILLQNVTGDPLADFGLVSVENGRLPIGLVIEQGIRRGDLFVVADITARDALDVLTGDQAYVIDKGDVDWGMFLWDGSAWVITSTEESAEVDSDTLNRTILFTAGAVTTFGSINGANSRFGSGTRVSPVSIEVITPFDGTPTISVGDDGDNSRLFSDSLVDLTTVGSYVNTPVFQYTGAADTFIRVYFSSGGATQGEAKITITYS